MTAFDGWRRKHGMSTGQRLAELRRQAGLTQRQLGDAVGVTDQTISNFERGETQPDVGVALAIAQRLGATVEDLFVPAGSTQGVEGHGEKDGGAAAVSRGPDGILEHEPVDNPPAGARS